jgi:dTMP kinase
MKGKLIVIEGTNSSGKQTQAELLVNRLNANNMKSEKSSFPDYHTPTGKIIGNCLLDKNNNSYFPEGINNIPPKVAALYYAADRAYNIDKINELLNQGINVILDRYVESNMAYQAAKFKELNDKINMLLWMEQLEFNLLDLPRPDKVIFLYLPYEYRNDKHEDNVHLKNTEMVYSLMAERYNFEVINCVKAEKIRSISEIHEEIYTIINSFCQKNDK